MNGRNGELHHPGVELTISVNATPKDTTPFLNIKTVFQKYGDSRVNDKTVERPSYV